MEQTEGWQVERNGASHWVIDPEGGVIEAPEVSLQFEPEPGQSGAITEERHNVQRMAQRAKLQITSLREVTGARSRFDFPLPHFEK